MLELEMRKHWIYAKDLIRERINRKGRWKLGGFLAGQRE